MIYKRRRSQGFSKILRPLEESPVEHPTAFDEPQQESNKKEVNIGNNHQPYWFSTSFWVVAIGIFMLAAIILNLKPTNFENQISKDPKKQYSENITPKPVISVPIIHIQADDRSDSAINNQDLQKFHCEISKENYQISDVRSVVNFASQAETVSQMAIETNSLSNICARRININNPGQQSGTSIILALEHILNLVESFRNKGKPNNVLVTLTIHETEPGPGQPLMNAEGLERMKKVVDALERERTTIVIFGAKGNLKKQLTKHFQLSTYQRICPSNELNKLEECMANAFRITRNWNY
jgi:hypothetical protein